MYDASQSTRLSVDARGCRFYGSERDAAARAVVRDGGVMLTTYGMVLHNAAQLAAVGAGGDDGDDGAQWDWIVCDEVRGHRGAGYATRWALAGRCAGRTRRGLWLGEVVGDALGACDGAMLGAADGADVVHAAACPLPTISSSAPEPPSHWRRGTS
jgi:hypothetical protein